jgi:molybdate transport system permease protein
MDITALLLTLRLAATTTVILLMVSLPLARWIVFSRSRLRAVVEAMAALPLVLPPTVLGFYLLLAMGTRTGIGRVLTHLLGHPLAFSFSGLVVGSIVYSLPFAVQPIVAGLRSVDPRLAESAAVLGASDAKIFREVLLPLSSSSIVAAAVLSFAHTVGEFGVVLMIGGNIPGVTRTLSISIFDQVQSFEYAAANRTALFLIAIAVCALTLVYSRRRTAVTVG